MKNFETCPACGRRITIRGGTICAGCQKRFHTRCMIRVRKKTGKTSYWLCPDCYARNSERVRAIQLKEQKRR